jgi:hypothetical protein
MSENDKYEINALVLCQRKSPTIKYNIDNVIQNYFPGKSYSVEYMSSLFGNDDVNSVDYAFDLDLESSDGINFINNHKKYYSIIILNTCPFINMNFEIISSIMKDDGIMIFSSFPNRFVNGYLLNKIEDYMIKNPYQEFNLFKFFDKKEDNFFKKEEDCYRISKYNKKTSKGGRRKNKIIKKTEKRKKLVRKQTQNQRSFTTSYWKGINKKINK